MPVPRQRSALVVQDMSAEEGARGGGCWGRSVAGETGEEMMGEVGEIGEKNQITRKMKRSEKRSRTGCYYYKE